MTAERDPRPALRVEADLSIRVAGTSARLDGRGDRLTLTCADPEQLWVAMSGALVATPIGSLAGPRAAGRLADQLTAAGLGLEVVGPHGTFARLGSGVHSSLGRAATGSYAVQPGSPLAIGAALGRKHRRKIAVVGATAVFAGLSAGLLAWARPRRH